MKRLTKKEALKLLSEGGDIMFKLPQDGGWKTFCKHEKTMWGIFAGDKNIFIENEEQFISHYNSYVQETGNNAEGTMAAFRAAFNVGKKVGVASALDLQK